MGLLDNFSFEKTKTNLLGTTPEEQSKALSSISSALRRSTKPGESTFGNVSQAIFGGRSEREVANKNSSLAVKKEARGRANDFLALMPNGKSLNDLSPEDQIKVKTYIESDDGDYSSLFNLDWKEGSTPEAPKTVTGFSDSGAKQTFQWDAANKDWTAIGGAEVSSATAASLSKFGKIAVDLGLSPGTTDFATKVQELLTAEGEGTGSTGTTAMENVNALIAHRVRLQKEVDAGTMTKEVMNDRMSVIRQQLNGGVDKGKTALANANVGNLEEQWVKYDTDSDLATDNMATINQSIELLDSGIYTGFGGEAMADLQNLGVSLGFSPPDANVGAEMFRVNSMKSVMDWIALTKGAISEKEMALFAAASPGLSRTVEGNRMILATAKKAAEWKIQRSSAYNEWYLSASKDGNIPNSRVAKNYIKSWEKAHQLVLPSAADIKAAKAGTKVANIETSQAGSSEVPKGVTAAEWGAMSAADKALWNN